MVFFGRSHGMEAKRRERTLSFGSHSFSSSQREREREGERRMGDGVGGSLLRRRWRRWRR